MTRSAASRVISTARAASWPAASISLPRRSVYWRIVSAVTSSPVSLPDPRLVSAKLVEAPRLISQSASPALMRSRAAGSQV